MKAIKPLPKTSDVPRGTVKPDPLPLFQKNLEAMREYYRLKPGRGVEMGHLVLLELCITDVLSALTAAMEGKPWEPPAL